jgi:hypothetical protein
MGLYHTLPFSVVAAKSLAAGSAGCDSIMASVVVHASCYGILSAQFASLTLVPTSTYRLLELLQELMCLLFLRSVSSRLHHIVRRQHRLEALLHSICGHGGLSFGGVVVGGELEAEGARRRRDGGVGLIWRA